MKNRQKDIGAELEVDEYGDFKLSLIANQAGRSALDIAKDTESTQGELQTSVKEEHDALSKYHGYRHTSSLFQAAKDGELRALRRLIEAGADMQPKPDLYEREASAIRLASKRSRHDIVQYLLETEDAHMLQSAYTPEALETAVRNGGQEEVARLVEAQKFLKQSRKNRNRSLREAAGKGDFPLVRLLISHGAEPEPIHEGYHMYSRPSALELAAKNGHAELVRYFLNKGAIIHTETHNMDPTPLKHAAKGGFLEIVEDLLKAGADPNIDHALHAAAFGGYLDVVNRLLEAGVGVDSSSESSYRNMTALQEASRGGHLKIVQRLLEAGANVNALLRNRGSTALQGAAKSGSVDVVQCLISAGADVNAPAEDYQRTALQAASEIGNLEIVNILLEAGATIETSRFVPYGPHSSAIKLAIENGHLDIGERLLEEIVNAEYEPSPNLLTLALHASASRGHEHLVKRLIRIGATVSRSDRHDRLIEHTASKGYTSIVEILLDAGADMESDSSLYSTPLQSAVKGGHLDTARLLLTRGANVNGAPARMKPPLHLACRRGDVGMVKMLLGAGVDVYAFSYSGKTARQSATKSDSPEIQQLLDEAEAIATLPEPRNPKVDLSAITKTELCSLCRALPFELFDPGASRRRDHAHFNGWHQSLITLRDNTLKGCPFCMFFWRQLGICKITIPQPSRVRLIQSFSGVTNDALWSQVEEPHPRDIEAPEGEQADFHVCFEPFEEKRKALPGDTGSNATFGQIRSWLDTCMQTHGSCAVDHSEPFLPTKLIDLKNWRNNETLRLIESKSIDTSVTVHPKYMTLSYKWTSEVTATASTTASNLSARLQSLLPSTLPLLFLHAIEAAHKIGVPYLWIDSLCILQDSEEDFDTEAAMMSKIYRNSYCTISAGLDDTSELGLFRQQDIENDSVEFDLKDEMGNVRRLRALKKQDWWEKMFEKGPLQQRAWCLQERELSPRIIHFTPTQVLWECRTHKLTQGLPTQPVTKIWPEHARMLDTIPSLTVPSIYAQWHHTVARYSSRHLTQYTDTFPAVSGLASIVSTYLTNAGENAQYVAGMWSTSIRTDLAWCSTESHPNVDRKPVRHPTYIAPSWSWASVNGKIAFSSENRSGKDTDGDASAELHTPDLTATIEKWDMQLSTRDSFGPLASARLYLRAPVVDAILEYYSASSSYFLNGPGGGPAQRIGHMTFDVPPESEGFTVVRCIALFRIAECEHARYAKEPTCGVGLAVVPVKGEEGVYRRVGRVGCLRMRWFEGVGEEGVVLV